MRGIGEHRGDGRRYGGAVAAAVLAGMMTFALLSWGGGAARAQTTTAQVAICCGVMPGNAAGMGVHNFLARKFAETIRQHYDYSCGSAALATLLTYVYDRPVAEQAVFADMIAHGDAARIRSVGFSLLDIKHYLQRHGFQAAGFKAPLDRLARVGIPALLLIDHNGYHHFVVLRGISDGRVLLSDPSLGITAVPLARFQREWTGIFFIILDDPGLAHRAFAESAPWSFAPAAPTSLARFQTDELSNPVGGVPDLSRF
jgi:uncharacterized protein